MWANKCHIEKANRTNVISSDKRHQKTSTSSAATVIWETICKWKIQACTNKDNSLHIAKHCPRAENHNWYISSMCDAHQGELAMRGGADGMEGGVGRSWWGSRFCIHIWRFCECMLACIFSLKYLTLVNLGSNYTDWTTNIRTLSKDTFANFQLMSADIYWLKICKRVLAQSVQSLRFRQHYGIGKIWTAKWRINLLV